MKSRYHNLISLYVFCMFINLLIYIFLFFVFLLKLFSNYKGVDFTVFSGLSGLIEVICIFVSLMLDHKTYTAHKSNTYISNFETTKFEDKEY